MYTSPSKASHSMISKTMTSKPTHSPDSVSIAAVFVSPWQLQLQQRHLLYRDPAPLRRSNAAHAGSWKMIVLTGPTQVPSHAPSPRAIRLPVGARDHQCPPGQSQPMRKRRAIAYWSSGGALALEQNHARVSRPLRPPALPNPDGSYPVPNPANPSPIRKYPFSNPPYPAARVQQRRVAQ